MSGVQTNTTAGPQYRGFLETVLSSIPITLPYLVFLYINGVMLFTLRSKPVLRETCRYILLYNLLFADTLQLTLGQLLYFLAIRTRLTYPVCGVLVILTQLLTDISPLTLVVMSIERCVAVCYPLRHSTVVTERNTEVAIIVIWALSSSNLLTRLVLLLDFPYENLAMTAQCSDLTVSVNPLFEQYDKVYKYLVFASAGVAVIASFIGVSVAATSASTDKASARKAHKTLLLHLFQLILSLLSTLNTPLVAAILAAVNRITALRMQNALYVVVVMLPRCLSALIYGIRDNTIRPILMYYLGCQRKCSVIMKKADVPSYNISNF